MPKRTQWYSILVAARRIVERSEALTSSALSQKVKFPVNHAAAWLRKFERWGYVRRVGTTRGKGRPALTWEMTTYGDTRKAPTRSNQPNVEKSRRTLRIAANPSGNQG